VIAADFGALFTFMQPHLAGVGLCAARLLPIAFLCPLLGGQAVPVTVKLSLALSFGLCLHFAGGIGAPAGADTLFGFWIHAAREMGFGTALGLLSALPFDAARMGGKFIDLFRGTSAEASLPLVGTKESAAGDFLYQLLVGCAAAGVALPLILSGVWRSFAIVPLGGYLPTELGTLKVVHWLSTSLAVALCIGAPVAAAALCIDAFLGFSARASPQLSIQDLGTPLTILLGGALLWLGLGLVSERLLEHVLESEEVMRAFLEVSR
jgi:flagellar biosynthetic protein FliR/type III secretion protein T